MQSPEKICCPINNQYPSNERDDDSCVGAKELTYPALKEAVNKCHEKIVLGEWTRAEGHAWLEVHCLNDKAKADILKCAMNCAVLHKAT